MPRVLAIGPVSVVALLLGAPLGVAKAQVYQAYPYYRAESGPSAYQRYRAPDPDDDEPQLRSNGRGHGAGQLEQLLDDRDYDPRSRPSVRSGAGRPRVASLPADADPAYSTAIDLDSEIDMGETARDVVVDPTRQAPGTITIDTRARKLFLSLPNGTAIEYGIGVGRQGFAWRGTAYVGRKAYWPGWTPPKEMLQRRPDLPAHMEGGIENPLGARALYLFQGPKDTLFRIHGTNEPDTIGHAVSSGCIRMLNADVIDLYRRVSKGAKVVVF